MENDTITRSDLEEQTTMATDLSKTDNVGTKTGSDVKENGTTRNHIMEPDTQGEFHGTKAKNGVYTAEILEEDNTGEDHELMMNEFGSMSFVDGDDFYIEEEMQSTVPTDRGWAWITVVGCFGMHILAVGGVKSFGVLFVELEHRYDTTTKALASVQAVATTIMMGMSPISNVLSTKFGCRRVVFVGGLFMGSGFITSAFVSSYQWLYFTYGVIGGLGFGLSYAPCIVFVGQHFHKYRALANGLSVSGSGVGTFLFPLLINLFTKEYGLSGAMLLVGGIMLNVCVCATLFRPLSSYKDRKVRKKVFQGKKSSTVNKSKESNDAGENLLVSDDVNSLTQSSEKRLEPNPKVDAEEKLLASIDDGKSITQSSEKRVTSNDGNSITKASEKKVVPNPRVVVLQSEMSFSGSTGDIALASMDDDDQSVDKNAANITDNKSKKKSNSCLDLFDWSLLKNPVFLVFLSSVTITNFAYPNVFVMIPSYGEEMGLDQTTGALFVSVIGISDLVGRVFFGWFSDRKLIQRKYEFMGTMGISGLLSLILPFVKSYGFVIAYCGTYGFFAGAYIALIAVVLVDTLGIHKLSSAFGFVGFGMMIGLLSGPPMIGALRDATSSWDNSFIFCGVLALLGASIILLEPLAQKAVRKKNENEEGPVIV